MIPLNIKHSEPEHEFHGISLCKEIRREVIIIYKVTVPNLLAFSFITFLLLAWFGEYKGGIWKGLLAEGEIYQDNKIKF